MFINLENGEVHFDDGYVLYSGLSLDDFKESKYYDNQNTKMLFTLNDRICIDNKHFYVSLYFEHSYLESIHLTLDDENVHGFEDLHKLKPLHDKFLQSIGLEEENEFSWGSIGSYHDPKGGSNDIVIRYKTDDNV